MTRSAPAADRHDARDGENALACLLAPWRVGGRVARNVYACLVGDLADGDVLIGQFDSGVLAREAVMRHNDARLKRGAR